MPRLFCGLALLSVAVPVAAVPRRSIDSHWRIWPTSPALLIKVHSRPGRDQLIVGSANGAVVVVDTILVQVLRRMQVKQREPVGNSLRTVVDPRGEKIVCRNPEIVLRAFDIDFISEPWLPTESKFTVEGFAPSGDLLVSESLGYVRQRDLRTGVALRRLGRGTAHPPISHPQVTPDSARLVHG